MTAYINELIITVVVCQAASMISPESENSKRYIRVVCALVTILTLVSPVRTLVEGAGDIVESFGNFFGSAEEAEENSTGDSLEAAAYTILTYAEENYDLDLSGAEVTFFTDEAGEVTELQMFVKSGDSGDRDKLAEELERELGVAVHIFMERRLDDG